MRKVHGIVGDAYNKYLPLIDLAVGKLSNDLGAPNPDHKQTTEILELKAMIRQLKSQLNDVEMRLVQLEGPVS